MARTLATEKQAEAIKQRMAEIRNDLPYAADEARQRLSQLTDWRYHMAKRPWPIVAAAIAAGYLIVPHKRSTEKIILRPESRPGAETNREPAKKGLAAGVAGTVATLLLKQAAGLAAAQVGNLLTQRGGK